MSENFIEASREKVKQLMERPLGELRLCAIVIDGTPFQDRQMVAGLGIGCDGAKTVLGIREGATENTAVALQRAAVIHFGRRQSAGLRRAQTRRNVVDHLPDEYKTDVRRKLQTAYSMTGYAEAKPRWTNCTASSWISIPARREL